MRFLPSNEDSTPEIAQNFLMLAVALTVGGILGLLILDIESIIFPLFAIVGAIVVWQMFSRPEIGLYTLLFITYLRLSDNAIEYLGAPSIAKFFVFVLLLMVLARWQLFGETPRGWQTASIFVLVYGAVKFSSLIYAVDYSSALSGVIQYAKNAIIAIVIVLLLDRPDRLTKSIWTLISAGFIMSAIPVYQYFTNTLENAYWGYGQVAFGVSITVGNQGERLAGNIGDPNFFSQFLIFLIPLALDRFWQEKSVPLRLFAGITTSTLILASVFTYSRGGFLAMIATLGLMFITRPPKPLAIIVTLLVALVILPFVPEQFSNRMQSIVAVLPGVGDPTSIETSNDGAIKGRTSEMIAAGLVFLDHPILGVGQDNYRFYYPEYSELVGLKPSLKDRSAHSLYFEIAAEHGLVGLAVYGSMVAFMLLGLWRSAQLFRSLGYYDLYHISYAVMVGVIGFLTAAILLHNGYPRFWWTIAGIGFSIPNVATYIIRQRQSEQQSSGSQAGLSKTDIIEAGASPSPRAST